jgi:arylsulfatase A-like enzyme
MLDEQVGRLLTELKRCGLLDNTVIVFTSDHGYHLGWRGQWCKHSIDEQVMRVPLIVRTPQGATGATADGVVELLDLFPTFCDIAGLPAADSLAGRSFLPLVTDPKAPGKAGGCCQWGNGRTIRTARYRYTERTDGSRELYDHERDPAEYFNVIDEPGNDAIARKHAALMEKELGPWPKPKVGSGSR